MSHKVLAALQALGLAVLATSVAILVALHAETRVLSLVVLLLEPLLWFGLGAGTLYAVLEKRWAAALVGTWSFTVLALALRQPIIPIAPPAFAPEVASPVVRNCASLAKTPQAPLRVLTWNVGEADATLAADIVQSEADLVVLQEATADAVDAITLAIQEKLVTEFARERLAWYEQHGEEPPPINEADASMVPTAEGIHLPAMDSEGLGLVVRNGEFSFCGNADRFPAPLPAAGGRSAQAVLVFAALERSGYDRDYDLVPLIGLHMDRPATPLELTQWPDSLRESASTLAGFARALNTPNLVVAGDTNTHGTFRGLPGSMAGVGLYAVPPRASWPAQLLGAPMLPLYQLDRVWHGDAWVSREVRTLRGAGDHLGVLATLEPRPVATAKGPEEPAFWLVD